MAVLARRGSRALILGVDEQRLDRAAGVDCVVVRSTEGQTQAQLEVSLRGDGVSLAPKVWRDETEVMAKRASC